jgi:hypothetical protein
MTQLIIETYTFDASAKTITFTNDLRLEGFQLITNVSTGDLIYQFNNSAKLGALSGRVLTLDYDTTAMADTDSLAIIYNSPNEVDTYTQNETMIELLSQIANKMVMPDNAYRNLVRFDTNSSLNNISNITNFGTANAYQVPNALMQGAYHIYSNIVVS